MTTIAIDLSDKIRTATEDVIAVVSTSAEISTATDNTVLDRATSLAGEVLTPSAEGRGDDATVDLAS